MKFPAIKYTQSKFKLLSTVLPFKIIDKKSRTLIYGKDEGGYQRIQDEKHFLGIKRYVEQGDFVFPNSIILAIDEIDFSKINNIEESSMTYLTFNDDFEPIFRVVDGQHRLLGINKAAENNPKLQNLELQVSIIVTPTNHRSVEMEVFSNINSKAKRLKTDLIELAKYDFRIIEEKIGTKELNPHIAINTAFKLNEDFQKGNIWQNAIKIDIHAENKIGIIGVTAFSEAIAGIIASYINRDVNKIKKMGSKELIRYSRDSADEISSFLSECWFNVRERWPSAFLDPYKVLDIDNQYKDIAYDPNYYIQKTLGCKAINYMISDILKEHYDNVFNFKSKEAIINTLYDCNLNDTDWQIGKTLSGISSESGFRKVTKILRNQENFIRKL